MFQAWPQLQTRREAIPTGLATSLTLLFRGEKNPFCKSIRLNFHFNVFTLDTSHFSFSFSSIVFFFFFFAKVCTRTFYVSARDYEICGPQTPHQSHTSGFFFFKNLIEKMSYFLLVTWVVKSKIFSNKRKSPVHERVPF